MLSLREIIERDAIDYYGHELNIVQMFRDPKVSGCYVCRVEDDSGNWCFIVNTNHGDTLDDMMFDDRIDLEPGQTITNKLFGSPRFF